MRTRAPFSRRVGVAAATAAAAATALTMAGLAQAGTAAGSDHDSRVAAAIASARSHVSTTRFGADQGFTAVGTVVDGNGDSHVRLHRTYHGLEVVGGDLVDRKSTRLNSSH